MGGGAYNTCMAIPPPAAPSSHAATATDLPSSSVVVVSPHSSLRKIVRNMPTYRIHVQTYTCYLPEGNPPATGPRHVTVKLRAPIVPKPSERSNKKECVYNV